MKKITREDAIRIFNSIADANENEWEMTMENYLDDNDDLDIPYPSISDIFLILGVTKEEYDKALKAYVEK